MDAFYHKIQQELHKVTVKSYEYSRPMLFCELKLTETGDSVTNTVYDERRVFVATVFQSAATFFICMYVCMQIKRSVKLAHKCDVYFGYGKVFVFKERLILEEHDFICVKTLS